MTIPKQVEENDALAREFISSLNPQAEDNNDQVATTDDDQAQVIETDETVDETVINTDADDQKPETQDDEATWEQRYKTLQGMVDKQYKPMSQELRELKKSFDERFGAIDENDKPVVAEPSADEVAAQERREAFRKEYSPEYVDGFIDLIRHELMPDLQKTVAPLQERVQSFEQTQEQAAVNEFRSILDTQVDGDWQALWSGNDPGFDEFRSQKDPLGLYTYGEIIDNANTKWDAEKMATVMNIYLGKAKPVAQATKQPAPDVTATVAPKRTSSQQAPTADEKTIWTPASFAEFQKNDQKGKYTPDVSKAMWDDALAAPSEGRFRDF